MLSFLPVDARTALAALVERFVLRISLWFYGRGDVLLAPNREMIDLLLMERGIDTDLFHPSRRTRTDDTFVMGFVGRLQPEKNVRFLARIEGALLRAGYDNFRFLIAGRGDERPWLEANLRRAEFAGVLSSIALAEAYANMDLFVFPSHTDTYANVILEAAASGVPSIVTHSGGPKFLVEQGVDGFVARDEDDFCSHVIRIVADRDLHRRMKLAAREKSLDRSWNRVFEKVYDTYSVALGR